MDALINRIVVLCNGDKKRAKTYIQGAMAYYPGQTDLWYLQKVISDLEQRQAEAFRQRRQGTAQQVKHREIQPANSQRFNYLLSLLRGDRNAASRLVESTRSNNSGKSEQWILDKVIFDLERDRH
jgi:hypothetical protein